MASKKQVKGDLWNKTQAEHLAILGPDVIWERFLDTVC
jgi:hypothetical protein